jgi:hypothetical protein
MYVFCDVELFLRGLSVSLCGLLTLIPEGVKSAFCLLHIVKRTY